MGLRKVASSVIIQYIGKIFGFACSLGTVAIITRYLGLDSYGEYTSILAIASLVIAFSDFGFFWSTIQNVVVAKEKTRVLGEISGLKIFSTVLCILIGYAIVALGHFLPVIKAAYWLVAIFILASSFNNVLVATYQSEYKMVWPTSTDALSRLANLVLAYWGSRHGYTLSYFLIAVSLVSAFNVLLNWWGLRRHYGLIRPQFFGFAWKDYYQSIFLLGLVQLFYVTFYRIDVIMLTWMKPEVDVAIYGVTTKVSEIVSTGSALFIGALFPLLVESYRSQKEKFIYYINRSLLVLLAVALPVAVYGQWFTRTLIHIIGGQKYLTASTLTIGSRAITTPNILGIILVFCLLNYLSVVFYTALLAAEQRRKLLLFNFIALMVNVILNLVFVPRYTYLATSINTVITELVILILTAVYFARLHGYHLPLARISHLLLALVPGVLFLLITPDERFYLRWLGLLIIYILSLRLLVWPKGLSDKSLLSGIDENI